MDLLAPSFRRRLAGLGLNVPDIVETEGPSANAPRAALHLLDDDPGGIPQALADERHNGFGDVVDQTGRLGDRQFFLKYLDGYEWHASLLLETLCWTCPTPPPPSIFTPVREDASIPRRPLRPPPRLHSPLTRAPRRAVNGRCRENEPELQCAWP